MNKDDFWKEYDALTEEVRKLGDECQRTYTPWAAACERLREVEGKRKKLWNEYLSMVLVHP